MVGNLRHGRVVDTHPESGTVSLVMLDDASRYSGVPVLSSAAGENFGFSDLPEVSNLPVEQAGQACVNEGMDERAIEDEKWAVEPDPKKYRTIIAVVGEVARSPVVLGFLAPQVSEIMFQRKGWRIDRHTSDFTTTIDREGNLQVAHPSGMVLRIGEGAPEDLEGQDYDEIYRSTKNRARFPSLRIQVRNAWELSDGEILNEDEIDEYREAILECEEPGELPMNAHADIEISPKGDVKVDTVGEITAAGRRVSVIAADGVTVMADTLHAGDLSVIGDVVIVGSLTVNGRRVQLGATSGVSLVGEVDANGAPISTVYGEVDEDIAASGSAGAFPSGTGTIWKPISHSDQRLVVVTASNLGSPGAAVYASDGTLIEQGRYAGHHNGNRGTYRFSKSGHAYPPNSVVKIGNNAYSIPDPGQRYD